MRGVDLYGILLLFGLFACRSRPRGRVSIDSEAFDISTCHSGEGNVPAFTGVDLIGSAGRKLRFVRRADHLRLFLFEAGATRGNLVAEDCGRLSIVHEPDSSHDLAGSVNANCRGAGHRIVAHVHFDHCH